MFVENLNVKGLGKVNGIGGQRKQLPDAISDCVLAELEGRHAKPGPKTFTCATVEKTKGEGKVTKGKKVGKVTNRLATSLLQRPLELWRRAGGRWVEWLVAGRCWQWAAVEAVGVRV